MAVNIIGEPADYGNDSMSSVSPEHPCPFTDVPFLQVRDEPFLCQLCALAELCCINLFLMFP